MEKKSASSKAQCENCITYAACKNKPMIRVVAECSIVQDILKKAQEKDKLQMKLQRNLDNKYKIEFEKLSLVLGICWSDESHHATARRMIWIWLDEGRY